MTPSWDLFIIIFFVIIAALGIMLGRSKVLNVLVGSFVGYVVATELGLLAHNLISTYSKTATVSLFIVKTVLFLATILVLNSKTELVGKGGDDGSSVVTSIYGVLAGGFIATALLSFLEATEKTKILNNSGLLAQIDNLKIFWIVGPVVFMIFADMLRNKLAK